MGGLLNMRWFQAFVLLLGLMACAIAGDNPLFGYANTSYSLGDWQRAREQVERLLKVDPSHPGALALSIFIDIENGAQEDATARLRRLQAQHPRSPYTQAAKQLLAASASKAQGVGVARLLSRAGRMQDAVRHWQEIFPDGLAPGPLAYEYVMLLKSLGQDDQARKRLRDLLRHYPGNLRYRLTLAELDARKPERRREAIAALAELAGYSSLQRRVLQIWRDTLEGIDDPGTAIPLLEDFLRRHPGDYAIQERLQDMRQRLARSASRAPARPAEPRTKPSQDPRLSRAIRLVEAGRDNEAEPLLRRLLREQPDNGRALGYLGLVALHQGRHHEAASLFRRALQHDTADYRSKWRSLADTARYWGLIADAVRAQDDGRLERAEDLLRQATVLDPTEATGFAELAGVRAAQGAIDDAESLYRRALRLEADNGTALRGLARFYRQHQGAEAAIRFLEGLNNAQRRRLGNQYGELLSGPLRDRADRQLVAGERQAARLTLQRAIAADPGNPWPRYDLARLLAAEQQAENGIRLFEEGLAATDNEAEMRYAYALYLETLDREDEAVAQLNRIPASALTPKYRATRTRLWAAWQRHLAEQAAQAGNKNMAEQRLVDAEIPEVLDTPKALLHIAAAWRGLERPRRAIMLLERGLQRQPQSVALQLALAETLQHSGLIRAAGVRIAQLWHAERLDTDETERLVALDLANTLSRSERAITDNRLAEGERLLDAAILRLPRQAALYRARAEIHRRRGATQAAIDDLREAVALAPLDAGHREALVGLLLEHDESKAALAELQDLVDLVPENDALAQARLVALLEQTSDARLVDQMSERLLRDAAGHRELLLRLARSRLHAGDASRANILYAHALLDRPQDDTDRQWADWAEQTPGPLALEVDQALGRQRRTLTGALDFSSRDGTDGLSSLSALHNPIQGRQPVLDGELFVHIEPTRLDAGSLDVRDPQRRAELGTNLLCTVGCNTLPARQRATGTALAVGYEDAHWRIDLGTTPIGFPIHYFIGGIRYADTLGVLDWKLEISRRPLASSLLSYAGAIDPHTGRAWGGVRATGVSLGLSHDEGGDWGQWASLQFHRLSGEHVIDNSRIRLFAGTYYKWLREEDQRISLSFNGMFWRHAKNAGEYTWGHGGYYSPARYLSLSTAIDWYGRRERWSWEARGSVSRSFSKTDSAPYFPTDPLLQANAEAIAPVTGITPTYDGGNGGGVGLALRGALEYRVNRFLHLGGRFSIERSDNYNPNRFMLYFRLTDRPSLRPIPTPPSPPEILPDF